MRRAVAVVLSGVLISSLVACSDRAGDAPDPAPVLERLAEGLTSGDLSAQSFTDPDGVSAEYAEVVDGMGSAWTPRVEMVSVDVVDPESDEAPLIADGVLRWTWTWSGGAGAEWSYVAPVALSLDAATDEWQVAWERGVVEPSLGDATVLDATTIRAARGDIVGAGGLKLIADRPVTTFGIDRSDLPAADAGRSARQLAQLVGVRPGPYAARVTAAGDRAFVEAITYRQESVPIEIGDRYRDIPGARALQGERALGPTPGFAVPVLGTVGEVTAEMIEEDPDRYQAGDVAGLSGLAARYDDQLTGTDGVVVNAVASDGKEREVFREEPRAGEPLVSTLSMRLQIEAETILADTRPASAIVAIKPSTGAIVVAANGPGTGGANVATFGRAAPGSTFKPIDSLALLRAGYTPDTVVPCTPSILIDGKRFSNYGDYPADGIGDIPLKTALAKSCNTAFISTYADLGPEALTAAAASLGMGIDHDIGFPAYFGQVPPPESTTAGAASMIGQGQVLASPMVMATVIASIQQGELVVPQLLKDVVSPPPAGVEPITADEAKQIQTMMRGAVAGTSRFLLDVPGPPVIAKTGTAEFDRDGKRLKHTWMIAAQGDLAVCVYVDEGASGSRTAGPLLEAFLRAARR